METVKQTKEYTIVRKRSGRHAVMNKKKQWINGDEKKDILLKENLIKEMKAQKKEEAPSQDEQAQSE